MDMTDLEDVARRYKEATAALDAVRAEMQTTAVSLLQQPDIKQADVARVTGWSREHLRRLREKAEMEALRQKVAELSTPSPSPKTDSVPDTKPEPERAPVGKTAPAPKPRREPEPRDGRPLTDEEAATVAALARSRATPLQLQRLEQDTESVGDAYKDFTVVSSALAMSLLTHDEVYGTDAPERPAGSEEKTDGV